MPEPIYEPGPVGTPYTYTVAGRGTVTPLACQAVYDGSGAGGNFVPAVIYRSQDGNVIARAILQSTITAGDDGEVSWFPGVKAAAAAATSALSYLHVVSDTTVPSGTISLDNGTVATISDFITNAPSVYTQFDASHWNMVAGTYFIAGLVIPSGGLPVLTVGDFVANVESGSGFVVGAYGVSGIKQDNLAYAGDTAGRTWAANGWKCRLTGSDTHAWSVHASIIKLA